MEDPWWFLDEFWWVLIKLSLVPQVPPVPVVVGLLFSLCFAGVVMEDKVRLK